MKDKKLKMNLQYFADPEGNDNPKPDDGDDKPKNVSREDFDKLSNTVNQVSDMFKNFINSQQKSSSSTNPSSAADPVKPKSTSAQSKPASKATSASDISKNPEFQKMMKQNEELQKRLDEKDKADAHNKLSNYANDVAQKLGIKLGGMTDSLLGEDEATTKHNVEEFAKTIKANSKTTNKGFNVNASQYKDGNSFMNDLLKNNFPNYKK